MKQPSADSGYRTRQYAGAVLLCGLCALLCLPLAGWLEAANLVMLFLLAVAVAAVWLGRGPGILAAFTSVALFDFLFVEPRYSLAFQDGQYAVTFVVMLLVALLISQLSSLLQQQVQRLSLREQRTRALYDCAHRLAGAMTVGQVHASLCDCLSDSVQAVRVALYQPDAHETLVLVGDSGRGALSLPEKLVVETAYHTGQKQVSHEFSASGHATTYLPLQGATRPRGVLVLDLPDDPVRLPQQAHLRQEDNDDRDYFLAALSSLLATALERLHFVAVAQDSELAMQTERLRSSILSSISHDIRTPLTVLCGMADTLQLAEPALSADGRDIVHALRTQAFRLHGMVENLLDMARLHSGAVALKQEWQPLEEIIGASIHGLGEALAGHPVRVASSGQLPLVLVDAVLMERVFCNLLENAAKYSPAGSPITITACAGQGTVVVQVCNAGAGFPPAAMADQWLGLFARGQQESTVPGFGIGLAICRAIIEAHGGTIALANIPADPAAAGQPGGACVRFALPAGSPPVIEPECGVNGAVAPDSCQSGVTR